MSDLSDLSVKELRALAEERDISLTGLKSKADIITRIEEVSTVDRMRAEVADDATAASKPKKPKGSPGLWPFLHLPRRERGKLLRHFAAIADLAQGNDGMITEGGELAEGVTTSDALALYDILAEAEEMLAVAATEADAYTTWVRKCGDDELMELLNWYVAESDLGEALSSSRS